VIAALILALVLAWPSIELHLAMRGGGGNPERPSIVMLGDSHTEFVNWKILLRCQNIANHGVGGNDTAQILQRLPEVLALNPKLIILMAGTNDARRYVPPAETVANLQAIKRQVTERGIEYVSLTPPPLPSRGDSILASVAAASMPIQFSDSDLLDDKIHLRRSGYAKWRDAIAPIVRRFC
jgi:lysophospholipase L1-like esterase